MKFLAHPGTWFILLSAAVVWLLVSIGPSQNRLPDSIGQLTNGGTAAAAVYPGIIRAPGVGLRESDHQTSPVRYNLPADEPIKALSRRREWLYVKTRTGATGWLRRSEVLMSSGEPPAASADGTDPRSLPK